MKYLVRFAQPVTYLPDHYRRRQVTELVVNAPSEKDAEIHAYRVCAGALTITSVERYTGTLLPLPDTAISDPPPITLQI